MMQLVGYRSWKSAGERQKIDVEDVRRGVALARSDMRTRVLASAFEELSDRDLDFLRAMLEDDVSSVAKDIGARTGMSSGNVSTYKKRLLEQGVIDEAGRGSFRFALPFMREYLQERFDFS